MSIQDSFFQKVLFDTPDCVKVLDLDARLLSMNENGRVALCIRNFADVEGVDWRTFWSEPYQQQARQAVDDAASGGVGHFIGRYDVEEAERWWDVTVTAMPGEQRLLAISRDITAERALAQVEARLKARIETRLRAIDEAGKLLSSSLDFEVTLSSLADIAVNAFATFCVLEVEDGFEKTRAVVRARQEIDDLSLAPLRVFAEDGRLTSLTQHVTNTGSSILERAVSRRFLESIQVSADVTAGLLDLKVHTLMTVPLVHDGVVSGAMTLCLVKSDVANGSHDFDSTDVRFAEELGRRAGLALANARSYGRERAIAVRMQESALPQILPHVDHLSLSVAYRPSSLESTIGGDWFDAFVLRDGRVALTLGDVGGHGLSAALVMTKLRQTMRATAICDPSVLTMLTIADELLRIEGSDLFATAVAAIYDPRTHELELASAGHPGPYVRRPDGSVDDLTASAPMLGLGMPYHSRQTIALEPGGVVAFFTDGLIEFDRDVTRGLERLDRSLRALSPKQPDRLADLLLTDVIGDRATPDDIAVLVATIRPPSSNLPTIG